LNTYKYVHLFIVYYIWSVEQVNSKYLFMVLFQAKSIDDLRLKQQKNNTLHAQIINKFLSIWQVIFALKAFVSIVLADPINLRSFPPCIQFPNFFPQLVNGRLLRREVDLTSADVAKDRISSVPVPARPNHGTPIGAAHTSLHPLATGITNCTRLDWCKP
jgi:hypothetical protein